MRARKSDLSQCFFSHRRRILMAKLEDVRFTMGKNRREFMAKWENVRFAMGKNRREFMAK